LFDQHREKCEKIAAHGLVALRQHLPVQSKWRILTHCNTGALATVGEGTALAVVKAAWRAGLLGHVFVDETRPLLQGSRLTAYELSVEKIPFHIITDSMAGYFLSKGEIDAVIVGADRITGNGDFANKIGTMPLALLAAHFKIPFFVAAPLSTFDGNRVHGMDIPIEFREGSEVLEFAGMPVAPVGCQAFSPAFDVTPGHLVRAFITDTGLATPPFGKGSVPPLNR
jgi:methylthioribose-1-phosphate isomerase